MTYRPFSSATFATKPQQQRRQPEKSEKKVCDTATFATNDGPPAGNSPPPPPEPGVVPAFSQMSQTLESVFCPALDPVSPPAGVDPARWPGMVSAALAFKDEWEPRALGLGWRVADLYGMNAAAPLARYDDMGLAWLLSPRDRVLFITAASALIQNHAGSRLRFYRRNAGGAV